MFTFDAAHNGTTKVIDSTYIYRKCKGINDTHLIFYYSSSRHQVSDVIVTSTMDSDNGLQVQLYVQSMREVISQQVVIDAVNVRSI